MPAVTDAACDVLTNPDLLEHILPLLSARNAARVIIHIMRYTRQSVQILCTPSAAQDTCMHAAVAHGIDEHDSFRAAVCRATHNI